MQNSVKSKLYNLLITHDYDPEMQDANGSDVEDPEEADMFVFDWKTLNKNYGTVVILVGEDKNLTVFFGDNIGRSMEGNDKSDWYEFLQEIKEFAVRGNFLDFNIQNINRLKYTMQGIAAIKEGLFEGYYGNKKTSYSDQPKAVRLVINHSRNLGEGDKRFRNIESLFVETADGEKFKVPTRNLMHGKLLARHVAEGGNPYDAFGNHINQVINEMGILSRFVRAARHKQFGGEAGEMCETAIKHYSDLKAKAKRMISHRGYHEMRESFDPAEITDSETAAENIRDMFLEQSLDERIEQAIPILTQIAGKHRSMKEADEFECWANNMTEGTWSMPDTPESLERLNSMISKPFPVGADATAATEQLYDIFGDDELFDQLSDLAIQDANADASPLIRARAEELGINLSEPADDEPAPADTLDSETPPEPTSEDLDTDGVMMTKQSNMSSESVERVIRLAQLLR